MGVAIGGSKREVTTGRNLAAPREVNGYSGDTRSSQSTSEDLPTALLASRDAIAIVDVAKKFVKVN